MSYNISEEHSLTAEHIHIQLDSKYGCKQVSISHHPNGEVGICVYQEDKDYNLIPVATLNIPE